MSRTLDIELATGRKWSTQKAVDLVLLVASAVQDLHKTNLVHGDLSPAEISMNDKGDADVDRGDVSWLLWALRPVRDVKVTPYTAPESIESPAALPKPSVDVYSLGVILYELLTGHKPFAASDPADLARSILGDAPTPPRQIDATIPAELEAICLKAMAKDPAARYRTASEFAAALRKFLKAGRRTFWKST